MFATMMHGAGDVRYEEVADPKIIAPTDAIIQLAVTSICGSDLWPYRGYGDFDGPKAMGHEYCGVVVEIGSEVKTVKKDNSWSGHSVYQTIPVRIANMVSNPLVSNVSFMTGAQAPMPRIPLADGTLVGLDHLPDPSLYPDLQAVSDVLGTGWYAADAARVTPGSTAVVIGDGAVGLMAVIAAKHYGAERIIAMSRHPSRQALAKEFGATDIVAERGEEGIARVMELTRGIGAESVLECVGMEQSMQQATSIVRPGGMIGYVGVPHGVTFDGQKMFFAQSGMLGGPAPVRRFLPELLELTLARKIQPGKVFDLVLPIADVAKGYAAMDQRKAIKTLLTLGD